MLRHGVALLWLAAGVAAWGAVNVPRGEYRARRAELRKTLEGALVLFGAVEGPDEVFGFRQEPNFFYLTGWTEPGAILLMTPAGETLFVPRHNAHAEKFGGRRWSAEDKDVQPAAGFDQVIAAERFESELAKTLGQYEGVKALVKQPGAAKLQALVPFREIGDAAPDITKLRVKKSEAELAEIQRATDVTIAGHRAAWKRMAAGIYEYQLAATMLETYFENGCEGVAYAPIVGSGPNGTVLHYSANKRRADSGEVVVMDAAAECGHYASDITRTVPVGGKFSARQRELYGVVLGAQKAALAAVKPGARLHGDDSDLKKAALDYINAHSKDLHGEPLGKYFTHGIGHQVGLQVHDPNIEGPLEAGMVITIEPGLYIPEEGIGIRIEDVVLVTEKGARVLSAGLPKEPEEIEKALAR
jgi:Xaa-Pro aminopeptidase